MIPLAGSAQKQHSFEFELAPIFSNRMMTGSENSSQWHLDGYKSQSEILPGFYLQFGVNFRDQKLMRFYTGLRLLNQQVMVSFFGVYNSYQDPWGNWILDGNPKSEWADMLYLSVPMALKQSLINHDSFRLVSEIGMAPGLLISAFSAYLEDERHTALSAEFGLSFEWKLKNGYMLGFKFPALSYSILSNNRIYDDIKQYNYSLGFGLKFGFGNSVADPNEKSNLEKSTKNFSFETEIGTALSNNRTFFNEEFYQDYNPNSYDYIWSQYEFAEFSKVQSTYAPGFYLQAGLNLRENKKMRFYAGIRLFEQGVMATAKTQELLFNPSTSNYEMTTVYGFEKIRMRYLSIPLSIKQTIVQKPNFRFGVDLGVAPGILLHDTSSPQYSQGNFTALPAEASFFFDKKLKNGNWIGVKFPAFSYSLFPNTLRNNILQYNYSIGLGVKLTLPQ